MQQRIRSAYARAIVAGTLGLALGTLATTPTLAAPGHHGAWQGGLIGQAHAAGMRYLDVNNAVADGYVLATGCVSHDGPGAMGVHYVNLALLGDDQLDADHPEALVYEPDRFGNMRLVAVEYMVFSDAWHAANEAPPVLRGQAMELVGAPNRYAIPAFYELHVWAFRHNPDGAFAGFNPRVTCAYYDPAP